MHSSKQRVAVSSVNQTYDYTGTYGCLLYYLYVEFALENQTKYLAYSFLATLHICKII